VVIEQFQGEDEEPLKLQLESFLDVVRAGKKPVISGEDGAAAVTVAHDVLQAIATFASRHGGPDRASGSAGAANPSGRR
jgi:predicted dehydrogenase